MKRKTFGLSSLVIGFGFWTSSCTFFTDTEQPLLDLSEGENVVILGGGMGYRMAKFGHFETEMYIRSSGKDIVIRNIADEGNTPGFRPHPGRQGEGQFAFPGARDLVKEEYRLHSGGSGHFKTADEWLSHLEADTIIAFFGYNSSFEGPEGLDRFLAELDGYVSHVLSQSYNGEAPPRLVLVSPHAFEEQDANFDGPDGDALNSNLALYSKAMGELAERRGIGFVDAFSASKSWYGKDKLTIDGILLNVDGHRKLGRFLAERLVGGKAPGEAQYDAVLSIVSDKNWTWMNHYKIPNGVHVYGRRYNPFGPDNYPYELEKAEEMTEVRERAVWAKTKGEAFDIAAEDTKTTVLPPVETNFTLSAKNGTVDYMPGEESEVEITTPEGYQMELFASEKEFPDLANPCQLSFDNKGRLWVSTMASYPHYRIGDPLPDDKLLILEDTDGDGKADKQTVFADGLHIPIGFEIAPEGVYVSQSDSLILLKDIDGDDRYDEKEIILSGFDDHDTHHAIAAFTADPSGALIMCEGLFLHSNVETIYGPVRGTNGGFFRYDPLRKKLTRHAQVNIPNPWGAAFDDFGQSFFLYTSSTAFSWMTPMSVKPVYGYNLYAPDLLTSNRVRPTSGLEFVSSSHFPDEVQGDVLINNNIGFLGAKQHQMIEDGAGFTTEYRQDLFSSTDKNFRPVDLEFAPDGSLYVSDWHNALIGHMQHSARDPLRDHKHGRIYRVTYPSRPLIEPAKVHGATIAELLENLKHSQYRTRYRTRRELRGRDGDEVVPAARLWAAEQTDDRLKLEAMWVIWGLGEMDEKLLAELLASGDHRVRSAAVKVVRFNAHKLDNTPELIDAAAGDAHGRVRLEALVAASWMEPEIGLPIVDKITEIGIEGKAAEIALLAANAVVRGESIPKVATTRPRKTPPKAASPLFSLGEEVYHRDGHCGTCHQENGQGLPDLGFPPLNQTKWVEGDKERLIKITLKGLVGPITVKGREYPGLVPMTGFEGLLNDREIAAVLTYVRQSFGNTASEVSEDEVKAIREKFAETKGPLDARSLMAD
ncbi:MAG: PVC-type heme-binding CxxCH protein [Verrucomicrobiota bacterium]